MSTASLIEDLYLHDEAHPVALMFGPRRELSTAVCENLADDWWSTAVRWPRRQS